jgi:hypothetical protein
VNINRRGKMGWKGQINIFLKDGLDNGGHAIGEGNGS